MQADRRKQELALRRVNQSARIATDFGRLWALENARRILAKMPPLKPPRAWRSRYSGAALRAIRAREVNFLGEMQR